MVGYFSSNRIILCPRLNFTTSIWEYVGLLIKYSLKKCQFFILVIYNFFVFILPVCFWGKLQSKYRSNQYLSNCLSIFFWINTLNLYRFAVMPCLSSHSHLKELRNVWRFHLLGPNVFILDFKPYLEILMLEDLFIESKCLEHSEE